MALTHDLRTAARSLRTSPRFTVAAVVALALGIGASATIFSVVDRLLFHPFPGIAEPGRVLWLFESGGKLDLDRDSVEAANFADWRAQAKGFSAFGGLRLAELTLTGGGDPERVGGQAVTPDYFAVMGLTPRLGRFFRDGEERDAVAVMGHGLWQRRFGGDPAIVGRVVEINGRATTIVGVLPADFVFPRAPDLVVPLGLEVAEWQDRKSPSFAALARLAPGVSLEQGAAELEVIAKRLEAEHPDTNRELGIAPVPIEQMFSFGGAMMALLAGVGLLLLIACGNVANLQLARGVARARELAVRQALGASRGRLVRLLLAETLLVSLVGAGLGLLLALLGVDLLVASLPESFVDRMPLLRLVAVNGDVLAFAVGLAVVSTLVAGLVPALRGSRVDLGASLKEGAPGAAPPRRRMMGALVVAQLALATALMAGAGVMLQQLVAAGGRSPGFRTAGIYTLRLPLETRHPEAADRARFVDQLLERLAALPGGEGAAATTSIPSTDNRVAPFYVAGTAPPAREEMPVAHLHGVTPEFFRTIELPILRGRGLGRADAGAKVVVVSDSIARKFFGDGDALGKRLAVGAEAEAWEIVGVAGDVPSANVRSQALGSIYALYDGDDPTVVVTLRARDAVAFGGLARSAVHELDARQVVEAARPMEQVLSERAANQRLLAWIAGVTSTLALLLAALGLYGLLSYAVGQRTREIGIRVALGAPAVAVMRSVLGGALVMVAVGLGLGLALAVPMTSALRAIFGAPGGAALPLAAVAIVMPAVAVVSAVLPARRALRVDPMEALRS